MAIRRGLTCKTNAICPRPGFAARHHGVLRADSGVSTGAMVLEGRGEDDSAPAQSFAALRNRVCVRVCVCVCGAESSSVASPTVCMRGLACTDCRARAYVSSGTVACPPPRPTATSSLKSGGGHALTLSPRFGATVAHTGITAVENSRTTLPGPHVLVPNRTASLLQLRQSRLVKHMTHNT